MTQTRFWVLMLFLAAAFQVKAQTTTFTEDFESYSVGALVAATSSNWTTGNNLSVGPKDVAVVDDKAASGSNSIYLSSNQVEGGPNDLLLSFNEVYYTGQFALEMNLFIEKNKAAHFNLKQTQNYTGGSALSFAFNDDGTFELQNGAGTEFRTSFPVDTWFNLRLEANLTTNTWEIYFDNTLQWTFGITQYKVGSLNLFPINCSYCTHTMAGFWVDDISYQYTPQPITGLNAGIIGLSQIKGVPGTSVMIASTIRNQGTETINNFEITWEFNGQTWHDTISALLYPGVIHYLDVTGITIEVQDQDLPLIGTISNINGLGPDVFSGDDVRTKIIGLPIPAPHRQVVVESYTSTNCEKCPIISTGLDLLESTFPGSLNGIELHQDDPMAYSGFQQNAVDHRFLGLFRPDRRGPLLSYYENTHFNEYLERFPAASILNGAEIDAVDQEIDISVTYTFLADRFRPYRAAVALVEDSVTGTGTDWAQANWYAGDAFGPMGGFENLPDPVPAAQMVYNRVLRAGADDYLGKAHVFPDTMLAGTDFTVQFHIPIDGAWDLDHLRIIGILINACNEVDNSGQAKLADAIANGLLPADSTYNITQVKENRLPETQSFSLFPNPAKEQVTLAVNVAQQTSLSVRVYDQLGKMLIQRNYGLRSGVQQLPLELENWSRGLYFVELRTDASVTTRKLLVE